MTHTYTMRIAVNGYETDTTVMDDDEAWDCKIGQITTTEGGGSFLREANHVSCSFTAAVPITHAPLVRTVTIAVQGPYNPSAPGWFHDNGDGTFYRIIFHGYVTSSRPVRIGDTMCRFDAISEMQGVFERRGHCAADNNSSPRDAADAVEAAHSLTILNNTAIPGAGENSVRNLDRPKQGPASNGDYLRTAMAGTGMSIVGEWDGTIAAPELSWRTDYAWENGHRFGTYVAARPWLYTYADVGIVPNDFIAKITVNGEVGNSLFHYGYVRYPTMRTTQGGYRPSTRIIDVRNGTRYYGWIELASALARKQVGNTEASLSTWIDTAAECEDAASFLMRRIGEPSYMKMYRVGWYPDLVREDADADPDFDPVVGDADDLGMDHATVMLGDRFETRWSAGLSFGDDDTLGGINQYGTWPAYCGPGTQTFLDLEALWACVLEHFGGFGGGTYYTVRTINRTWTPQAGWYIECALEPYVEGGALQEEDFTDHIGHGTLS